MSTITKEVYFDTDDIKTVDLLDAMEERISNKTIEGFHNEAYIEKMKPLIAENIKKLEEIRLFLLGY